MNLPTIMNGSRNRTSRGFTLIEMLLYVSLIVIVMGSIVAFLWILMEAQTRHQVIAEVEQQGIQIMQVITKNIENARKIETPFPGTESGALIMYMEDGEQQKIQFSMYDDVITMTEEGENPVHLMNNRISASSLRFQNLASDSSPTSRDIIRIEFTITYKSSSQKYQYIYSQKFYGSAILRQ